jgi:hypothetical protein
MCGQGVLLATALLLSTLAAAMLPSRNLTDVTRPYIRRKPVEFSPSVSVFFMNDMLLLPNDDAGSAHGASTGTGLVLWVI